MNWEVVCSGRKTRNGVSRKCVPKRSLGTRGKVNIIQPIKIYMPMAKKLNTKKPNAEPRWKTIEKVVALLEKSLSPDALVRHNVQLPCISTGHLEQCDVVIEIGQVPRMLRTIVEVQNRNHRVKPNDFRGWCQKMKDVGANRLICVSTKPFPQSIKDKVLKEYGLSVLLVRLEALELNQWPFQIVNNAMKILKPIVEIDGSIRPNPLLMFNPEQNPFQELTGQIFCGSSLQNVIQRSDDSVRLPLADLINEGVRLMNDFPDLDRLPEGNHKVTMQWHPKNVTFCYNNKMAPIQKVIAVYNVQIRATLFPFEVSSYTQVGHNPLAWIVRATGKLDGEDAEIRFTCNPTKDGHYSMSIPQVFGVKDSMSFYMSRIDKPLES
jgi:hypothetical protein